MLRRDFLKYLSAIPFLGSLFAQGESGASEGQPEKLTNVGKPQKFHAGDRVHITANMPSWKSHFPCDKDATVLYSYGEEYCFDYRHENERYYKQYALEIDGKGFSAWYEECLLTRICNIEASKVERFDEDAWMSEGCEILAEKNEVLRSIPKIMDIKRVQNPDGSVCVEAQALPYEQTRLFSD